MGEVITAPNADSFYSVKQTLQVKSIVHAKDKYPKRDEPTKTWYKHLVTFHMEDDLVKEYSGTFFQLDKEKFEFEGKEVIPGDTICFIPVKFIDDEFKDQLKFCYDKTDSKKDGSNTGGPDYGNPDSSKIKSVSLSYAKDICIEFFKGKENILLDHIADEAIRIGKKFEEYLLK